MQSYTLDIEQIYTLDNVQSYTLDNVQSYTLDSVQSYALDSHWRRPLHFGKRTNVQNIRKISKKIFDRILAAHLENKAVKSRMGL